MAVGSGKHARFSSLPPRTGCKAQAGYKLVAGRCARADDSTVAIPPPRTCKQEAVYPFRLPGAVTTSICHSDELHWPVRPLGTLVIKYAELHDPLTTYEAMTRADGR